MGVSRQLAVYGLYHKPHNAFLNEYEQCVTADYLHNLYGFKKQTYY